ncbi:c-type cytochrome [Chenggangzhangella methanolivorans]|uniref:c-type cytochrome n=2 Tax=Chenggangzhangella methanolivorans TaxID=1437009 RepID=UPI003620461A
MKWRIDFFVTPLRVALAAVAVAGGVLAFGWSGLFSVAATSGHWPITDWFLHYVMINSVKTHSIAVETPRNLDDPALIARGAGHYASGCASCHGAPGRPRNPVIREMVPTAPDLDAKVPTWEPKHLFWIVKNGVKYAGMPAWVSAEEREDEVWAVVAFLLKLPGMSDETYRRLAMGQENDGAVGGLTALAHRAQGRGLREDVLADCARCHGRDGMGRDGDAFPVIAGQSEDYIYDTLAAYALNKRYSGVMETAAARLPYSDIAALAEHYAAQPRKPVEGAKPLDPALVARGEKIAREGLRDTGTPACSSCHGPGRETPNPAYPKLAGQHASYLETQLTLWEKEHDSRGGGPFSGIMRKIAFGMTEADIKAVAAYYASLPPGE